MSMTEIKLMNMCMIHDKQTNRVVVQEKVNRSDWNGITFPGGHVEKAEGLITSTVREIKEETGLDIDELKFCGLINWYNTVTHERWFVFLYKSHVYSGEMLDATHEGKVYWLDYDKLFEIDLASDMNEYLKLFLNDDISEAYAEWNDDIMTSFTFY